ncbi:MAG: helix-turn-helix domain-containing protein [Clostridiales bacterium]|nr:helix-turn-helix domain-containing protein [Clostridiales bacterium]
MRKEDYQYPQIDMPMTGKRLRSLSRQSGITVKEIQKALGLASNQAIYDWFNGKNLPTLNNFLALSRLFHVSMEEMLIVIGQESVIVEPSGVKLSIEKIVWNECDEWKNNREQRLNEYSRLLERKCA